jgi:hypothetical protein
MWASVPDFGPPEESHLAARLPYADARRQVGPACQPHAALVSPFLPLACGSAVSFAQVAPRVRLNRTRPWRNERQESRCCCAISGQLEPSPRWISTTTPLLPPSLTHPPCASP